ncbi:BTAD domain-containing putative transcriptional regulator [Rhizobium calliandrae]|uniref:BTAD domain-containing putative transcriptional regulator n=1 Tax=Rhizobium calliandrae TaxID=1312182 RepID=A0ABT7K827_9HYPH|nr:BTAD domain-containing putative transcriptional regulator [Rhizobium calliandrae]MDL2404165.1 BTAD domain-containing putative transcriptional regulator [Rhizobium calliandrae]
MDFRLLTFGDLRLVDGTGSTVPFPEKGLLAACFLLTSSSTQKPRAELAEFLWGDIPLDKALANLRQTLSRVKSRQDELRIELLRIEQATVGINVQAFTNDLASLNAVSQADPHAALKELLQLGRWDFLARTEVIGGLARMWLRTQRDRIKTQMLTTLRDAIAAPGEGADATIVKEAALRLFEAHPEDEAVYQLLGETYAGEPQLESARHIFESRRKYRWGELPVDPDPQTLSVARRLFERQRSVTPQRREEAAPQLEIVPPTRRGPPKLVLLPPINLARNHEPAIFLSSALLEDITVGLCVLKTVTMVAHYTAEKIALHLDRAAMLEKYAINYVLDTRLSFDGSTYWLFAQLIYAGNDEVIWAERFSLEAHDLPRQHREIAQRIVASAASYIERSEFSRDYFERNPDAYRQYLLGQRHLKHLDLPDIRRARKAFQTALRENPYFSPALSGVARTYHLEWLMTAQGDERLLKLSEEEAGKAIAAGQDITSGYREFGVAKLFRGAFDESIEAFKVAETISPHYADLIADYADTLIHASKPREGLEKIEQAIKLNPISPDIYFWTAAGASYHLGQYKEAMGFIDRMAAPAPAARLAAATAAMAGDMRKAKALVRKVKETYPDFEVDTWLSIVPIREQWQKDHYREGLRRAGF